ncbi:MAG: hypothetical protein HKL95_02100 [Phycisphaerae bacterium]|nr:hypothetical protein [Phycisphaerae bacterium]
MSPQHNSWSDDADDELPDDNPEFEETGCTMPCPECHRIIDMEASRCPHCGAYISEAYQARRWPRWWLVVVWVLVGLALVGFLLSLM